GYVRPAAGPGASVDFHLSASATDLLILCHSLAGRSRAVRRRRLHQFAVADRDLLPHGHIFRRRRRMCLAQAQLEATSPLSCRCCPIDSGSAWSRGRSHGYFAILGWYWAASGTAVSEH